MAAFTPDDSWEEVADYYEEGSSIFVTPTPRMLFLNTSNLLITQDGVTKLWKKSSWEIDKAEGWKILRYVVVYFLDRDKNLLSSEPFKIKLIGQSGINLYKAYSSKKSQCFRKKLLAAYKKINPKSKGVDENFLAHAIFSPTLVPETLDFEDGSIEVCQVESFEVPSGSSKENFLKTFVSGKNPISFEIKSATASTKKWVEYKE